MTQSWIILAGFNRASEYRILCLNLSEAQFGVLGSSFLIFLSSPSTFWLPAMAFGAVRVCLCSGTLCLGIIKLRNQTVSLVEVWPKTGINWLYLWPQELSCGWKMHSNFMFLWSIFSSIFLDFQENKFLGFLNITGSTLKRDVTILGRVL